MQPNIIIIMCDTLRKSIMDRYGGPAKLPNINAFARDSMVYDNCIAPATWTFPTHTSMFTGMYANEHGVHETKRMKIAEMAEANTKLKATRLAETLESKGYNTICVSNNFMISRHTGFDYGFKTFITLESSPWSQSKIATEAREIGMDPMQVFSKLVVKGRFNDILRYAKEMQRIKMITKAHNYPLNKGAEFTNELLFNSTLNQKFFLFINFWEMHEPYVGFSDKEMLENLSDIKKFSEAKVAFLKQQYVNEGEFLDAQLGKFFSMLKLRGIYENSMIILTSDHGQSFNEHGFMYHGVYLYDEIVRIPLIIKYPNSKKFRKRSGYQSLVNVPKLIKRILAGGDDSAITTDSAFAEAYGGIEFIPESYEHVRHYMEEKYDKVRKAVYSGGYKLTLNGTDGTIEEFSKDGKEISKENNQKVLKSLVNQIDEFRGEEKFKLPRI
jgi:arylsulfatase A-like enzyme